MILQPAEKPKISQPASNGHTAPGRGVPHGAVTLLTEPYIYLFNERTHWRLHKGLGAHPLLVEGVEGTYFAM